MAEEKEVKRDDILIENNVATWNLHKEGAIEGTYIGTFKFRCYLTPTQQIAANREYRSLLGENPAFADEHVSYMSYALTQLKQRIISAPPFWASTLDKSGMQGDLADTEVITEVLAAATDSEVMYRQIVNKRKKDAIEKAKIAAEQILAAQKEKDESEDEEDLD